MANPILSQSRVDKRPPAGKNPPLPEWAKGDYVLERWVGEERQRRRNWLMDQRLHPSEPRPEFRPANPFIYSLKKGLHKYVFKYTLYPLDNLTGNRLRPLLYRSGFYLKWYILPVWVTHYFVKYHIATTPGFFVVEKSAKYPDNPLHKEEDEHH